MNWLLLCPLLLTFILFVIPPTEANTLKIMTFNVYKTGEAADGWATRRDELKKLIESEKPDVLALQGLLNQSSEGTTDQFSDLLHSFPPDLFQDGTRTYFQNTETSEGGSRIIALLTKQKHFAGRSWFRSLPALSKQSSMLHVPLTVGDQTLNIFTTEFSSFAMEIEKDKDKDKDPQDTELHQVQLRNGLDWIKKMTHNFTTGPTVVLGDFKLKRKHDKLLEGNFSQDLNDAWLLVHGSADEKAGTYPKHSKTHRFDRIFVNGNLTVTSISVKSTPSSVADHYFLVAELSIAASTPAEIPTAPPRPEKPPLTGFPEPTQPPSTEEQNKGDGEGGDNNGNGEGDEGDNSKNGNQSYVTASKSLIIVGCVLGVFFVYLLFDHFVLLVEKKKNQLQEKERVFQTLGD
eukprot:TRINITY_DN146_c1_g1_i1.p1 TRINITY_DN146_c1_g1~~TRINITY_DN146_c1_g1_i1.p1  ORF type:complete len:404 (-),score=87.31 TRINITY_DN146_c1_g1_i1:158-1369(-)